MIPESRKSIVIAGLLLLAATIVLMLFFDLKWPKDYGRRNIRPTLALELPHDGEEFQAIVRLPGNDVRVAQRADFGFIAVYVIFFGIFALGVEDDRTMTSMILATLVTAVADIGENAFILHAVATAPTPSVLRTILIFGCAKWIAFFAIVFAAAVAMNNGESDEREEHDPKFWPRIAALLLRLFALVGIYGAIASFASAAGRPLVAISTLGTVLTFFVIVAAYFVSLMQPRVPAAASA